VAPAHTVGSTTVVVEAGSARAAALWDGADRVVSDRLVYAEGRAALAEAHRLGRLTLARFRAAVTELDSRYEEFDLIEVDDPSLGTQGDSQRRIVFGAMTLYTLRLLIE
jgi:hypothetical protein